MAVNVHTTQYQFGKDELAENTHGWLAAQNTSAANVSVNTNFLLRCLMQETGGTAASNHDFRFRYSLNGAAFVDITTTSTSDYYGDDNWVSCRLWQEST